MAGDDIDTTIRGQAHEAGALTHKWSCGLCGQIGAAAEAEERQETGEPSHLGLTFQRRVRR